MKAITMKEVPVIVRNNRRKSKYEFVSETIKLNKVCLIEPSDYTTENTLRSGISAHLRKLGLKYSIRKDHSTGNFYVFPEKG